MSKAKTVLLFFVCAVVSAFLTAIVKDACDGTKTYWWPQPAKETVAKPQPGPETGVTVAKKQDRLPIRDDDQSTITPKATRGDFSDWTSSGSDCCRQPPARTPNFTGGHWSGQGGFGEEGGCCGAPPVPPKRATTKPAPKRVAAQNDGYFGGGTFTDGYAGSGTVAPGRVGR
jgi:hypothetical protein